MDMQKLARSLKGAAKAFGDSTSQALVRWSVRTCAELAVETQVYGKTKTRGKQEGAILWDAVNVIMVRPDGERISRGRMLSSADEINEWIEINRTRRRGRTAKLPRPEKKETHQKIFDAAMRARYKRAGMAKGGWIGAGQQIARRQKGQARINIGKNWLGYAHKHSKFGTARMRLNPFNPVSFLTNSAKHITSRHVLNPAAFRIASIRSLRATTTWYRRSLRSSLGK